ncbi:MAG: hypothetical protein ACXQS6_04000 [Candidatus Syntropharchaeales archaeon]
MDTATKGEFSIVLPDGTGISDLSSSMRLDLKFCFWWRCFL